jgi:alpha-galactosidase
VGAGVRSRFPGGLKTLAERVRARGMKLGLWFEPERSGPQSLLAREHPDWVVATEKRKWKLGRRSAGSLRPRYGLA